MRPIIFRGKLLAGGDWVYGQYVCIDTAHCIYTADAGLSLPVDYRTVGQFTGVYDSNHCPIYEGDIVQDVRTGEKSLVRWTSGGFYVPVFCDDLGQANYDRQFRVVGDVYALGNFLYDDEKIPETYLSNEEIISDTKFLHKKLGLDNQKDSNEKHLFTCTGFDFYVDRCESCDKKSGCEKYEELLNEESQFMVSLNTYYPDPSGDDCRYCDRMETCVRSSVRSSAQRSKSQIECEDFSCTCSYEDCHPDLCGHAQSCEFYHDMMEYEPYPITDDDLPF